MTTLLMLIIVNFIYVVNFYTIKPEVVTSIKRSEYN